MITFLKNLFLGHWQRKTMALVSAILVWLIVHHSLTTSRSLENVAIRIVNIPAGLTIEGIEPSGLLSQRVSLTIEGKKTSIENISSNDVEILLDATDKSGLWTATVTKKHLNSLNPSALVISEAIDHIAPCHLSLQFTRLLTEKIPITITAPKGQTPPNYQYLDVWPSHLYLTLSGPKKVIEQLKAKGLTLTFDLDKLSKDDFENIKQEGPSDEISFLVPDAWKKISVPGISERPIEIDDPQASLLRIDFIHSGLLSLTKPIPIHLYFPPDYSLTMNPETYSMIFGGIIQHIHGLSMITKDLYVKGVSQLFLQVVQDAFQITVLMAPKSKQRYLEWSLDAVHPRALEDKYVQLFMSDTTPSSLDQMTTSKKEEYLRGRFRKYLSHLLLYRDAEAPLDLKIELEGNAVRVEER
ncbi:MAG: hypothetical protein JSR58_02720 [Verrucomicrobia bacterium]|nr:hypothetical protein [Verrucomicrobiota bacterium]